MNLVNGGHKLSDNSEGEGVSYVSLKKKMVFMTSLEWEEIYFSIFNVAEIVDDIL